MSTDLRKKALINLINFNGRLEELKSQLSQFPWDSDEDVVILRADHIKNMLGKFLDSSLDASLLVEWANLIELRDDVGFSSIDERQVKEVLFALANPETNGLITPEAATKYLKSLE